MEKESNYYEGSSFGAESSFYPYRSLLALTVGPACLCDGTGSIVVANSSLAGMLSGRADQRDLPETVERGELAAGALRLSREESEQPVSFSEAVGGGELMEPVALRGFCLHIHGGVSIPVELRVARVSGELHFCVFRDLRAEREAHAALAREEAQRSTKKRLQGVGHDLNNALTALRLEAELLFSDETLSESARQHLSNMVSEISDAGAIGAELAWPNSESISHHRTGVWDVEELLRQAAHSAVRGTNVRCEITSSAPSAYSNIPADRLEQIVRALVTNAAEAMFDGGVVRVRVSPIDRRTQKLQEEGVPVAEPGQMFFAVVVSDTGDGIAEVDRGRIFEPYFTTKRGSAGLGLTVAKQTLSEFGGGISVCFSSGEGTVVTAFVPVYGLGHKRTPTAQPTDDAARFRVLVMDDDERVRSTMRETLRQIGYRVTITSDGHEAVYMYEKALEAGAPFDLCILDSVVAGGLSGEEAMRRILHHHPQASGVLMRARERTESNLDIDTADGESPFVLILYKPFGLEAVGDAVTQALAQRSA